MPFCSSRYTLFPTLGENGHLPPVFVHNSLRNLLQGPAFQCRQIGPFSLRKDRDQVHWHGIAREKRHGPVAAALAFSPTRETDLPAAAGPRHLVTGVRILREVGDKVFDFLLRHARISGGGVERAQLGYGMHDLVTTLLTYPNMTT